MMERLTFSGTKEAKSNVTVREALCKLAEYEDLEEEFIKHYGVGLEMAVHKMSGM